MTESSMSGWMRSLADQHGRCRGASSGERLLVVFDIDGTILNMRHMRCPVLSADDRWEPAAVLEAHRPCRGVMEVIRWFQLQPSTFVGLNTGRPESLRAATLRSLNALGREYRVHFDNELLQMNSGGWGEDTAAAKVDGLRAFAAAGYRVVAVVDNEPEILEALAASDETGDVLFVHAQTLDESRRVGSPRTVAGDGYDLRSLIAEPDLPQHVQIVWHGVNDSANLRQFLASAVHWGEVDVRYDPHGKLVLRHDAFEATPAKAHEQQFRLDDCLDAFGGAGRGVKLDLKEAAAIDEVLRCVRRSGLDDDDLWFNGRLDTLGEHTFRHIVAEHPRAVVQCPIDFLGPVAAAAPAEAKQVIEALTRLGVNRFSVSWAGPHVRLLLDLLDEWGHEMNIYAVPDLGQFLRAVLLLPRSITADFNFPEWHYFGRGAGHRGLYHRYQLESSIAPATDVA
jgi:hypothetical protein